MTLFQHSLQLRRMGHIGIDRHAALRFRREKEISGLRFHDHVEVVIDRKLLNAGGQVRISLLIGAGNHGCHPADLLGLHGLIGIIEKINLQKPDQKKGNHTESEKVHPQAKADALKIESNLRTQTYNPPLLM